MRAMTMIFRGRFGFFLATVACGVLVSGVVAQEKPLPRVVLIGDSIRLGYAPFVAKLLEGKAIVLSPKPNGEDSRNVLKNLDEWVIKQEPDIVHINAGLHDLKRTGQSYQVPLADYESNLRTILNRIQKETRARIIFATTTPIVDTLHALRKTPFDRFEKDVQVYNATAVAVMKQAGVPINDLHKLVEEHGKEQLMAGDGTHYTDAGYELLATAVAQSVLR